MRLWLNGSLIPTASARIDPSDRGFTLGDGLFETIRVRNHAPALIDRHLARLRDGAGRLEIPLIWSDAEISAAIAAVRGDAAEAIIRLTLTRGPAARGLLPQGPAAPTLLITAGPPPAVQNPAQVVIATITRRNEASPLARLKTLNYLDNILARQEAIRRGADEALLLNTRGQVAEATIGNLFILDADGWVTPPIADGALPGIMRGVLLERGGCRERSLAPADVLAAGGAFISNSLGLRAIASVDGVRLPDVRGMIERMSLARGDTA